MRHQKRRTKLSRTTPERRALLSNMVMSLYTHQSIKTTLPKAKEASKLAEKLITLAKDDTVHARRLVERHIRRKDIIKLLFNEVAPLFKDRNGGYTRIYQLGFRNGDAAKMAILELVEKRIIETSSKKTTNKKATKSSKSDNQDQVASDAKASDTKATSLESQVKSKKEQEKKDWMKSVKKLFGQKEQ